MCPKRQSEVRALRALFTDRDYSPLKLNILADIFLSVAAGLAIHPLVYLLDPLRLCKYRLTSGHSLAGARHSSRHTVQRLLVALLLGVAMISRLSS